MKWDRRKNTNFPDLPMDLPVDYLKLVTETLTTALEPGLKVVHKTHPKAIFTAGGAIFGDEVFLAITLSQGAQDLSASTVYASADYHPNHEKPGIEATLSSCLEAAGATFDAFLSLEHPEKVEQLLHTSLSSLEEAPFEWTEISVSDTAEVPVFVKMDKANPALEILTDQWLSEHDPEYKKAKAKPPQAAEAEEFLEERLEAIKSAKSGSSGSGPITH